MRRVVTSSVASGVASLVTLGCLFPPLAEGASAPAAPEALFDSAAAALFAGQAAGFDARPLPLSVRLPEGEIRLNPRLPAGARLAPRMVVNVDIEVDARHWRTIPVWFAVQSRGAPAVATSAMAASLDLRPAVACRQPVQVRVHAGPVELQTTGLALNDGRIGDLVNVFNPTSRKSYPARVVADGLVVVAER